MTPGNGPEGFAISPDGKKVAAALLLGSGARQSDWFRTKGGEIVLMSLDSNKGDLTVIARAPLGGLPEGLAFSPKSDYLYVGNYFDTDLQVFRVSNESLRLAGPNIKLGGQPASMRALPH
jgi:DNA-binding beta-propeller fold protein YncE